MSGPRCHDHGTYLGNDLWDAECCMCGVNPCTSIDGRWAVEHGQQQMDRQREAFTREVEYAAAHGHPSPAPWDEQTCPPECRAVPA